MRRLASLIGIVAASVLLVSAPVLATESIVVDEGQRNECLLVSKNCTDNVDTIQQRIDKLNKEISKGTDVYTRDELRILNRKLDDSVKTLETIEMGG